MTRCVFCYSHFVDNWFIKKHIVQGQGAVLRVQHPFRITFEQIVFLALRGFVYVKDELSSV